MRFFKALHQIKAVSFDLDDTLYDNVPVIAQAEIDFAAYLCKKFALPAFTSKYEFWAQIKAQTLAEHPEYVNDVTLWREHSLQDAFARLNLTISEKQAHELIAHFIHERSKVHVPAGSVAILHKLRQKFPVAAVSNGNSDLHVSGLIDCFDYDLRPSLQGCAAKPEPDLFRTYASLVKVEPQEILHIGDDPVTDVQGAMQAGCQCCWLRGGYARRCQGFRGLKTVPTFLIDTLEELNFLWTS